MAFNTPAQLNSAVYVSAKMVFLRLGALLGVTFLVAPDTAVAQTTITEPAEVIDGDTLRVHGITVRLKGISAPELDEPGGRQALDALRALVGRRLVRCELTGEMTRRREVGYCEAAGRDLQAELVRTGVAMACPRYSRRYVSLEAEPRSRQVGVWSNGYTLPGYCVR